MDLRDEDLEVTIGCDAVHPDQRGGQHVAMHCTGVRILHRPTGISVLAMDERSQHANRIAAVAKLRDVVSQADRVAKLRQWATERAKLARVALGSLKGRENDAPVTAVRLQAEAYALETALHILDGGEP